MQKISVAILNDIIRYLDNDLIEFYTDNYQKNKYDRQFFLIYLSYFYCKKRISIIPSLYLIPV